MKEFPVFGKSVSDKMPVQSVNGRLSKQSILFPKREFVVGRRSRSPGITVNLMDNFMNTAEGFEATCRILETVNRATDDYLFVWDIPNDVRWFYGDIDAHYNIRKNGSDTNNTAEMLRIIHSADRAAVLASLNEVAQGKKNTHDMDYRWVNREGQKVWINCHGTVVRDKNYRPYLMIGRVSEEKLRHLFNPLTGLWNKGRLLQDLTKWLEQSKGYMLLLDIDSLSAINLSRGRAYGDQLLKEVAEYCEYHEKVRMAYHVDHDHFALILDADSQAQVQSFYKEIGEAMGEKCTFTASAVPIDKTLFIDKTQLMDSVNMTLKKAKSISHNRIEFFSTEELNKKIRALALLQELKQSVENGCEGFEVYYQPQILGGSYKIYGVEALLRYHSKTRGRVFPDEFIPVLEQSRLIHEVGLWVLQQAVRQCKQWRQFLPELRVSVNFSILQFEDVFLAEKVIKTVKEAGLAGDALTVEITESMELHSRQTLHTIQTLRAYNIGLAIDDFGTGYSNLGYLKQLHINEIKIDRTFVSGIANHSYHRKLTSNLIAFAKANAIRTCCEGVENTSELATLERMAPDVLQGYLFDKPNTAEMIERIYIQTETVEYQNRLSHIQKLQEMKESMNILRFDPKEILHENGIGLWVMRIKEEEKRYELHVDETMQWVMASDENYTPRECFDYWISRIHPDYVDHVMEYFGKMIRGEKAVQVEFPWQHTNAGEVRIRFSGKRVEDKDGMVVLEGYCKIITGVTGA